MVQAKRTGGALHLTDDTDEAWRVHDAHFTGGKPHRVPLSDPKANTRYFVAADGSKKPHTFARGRRRDLTVETLVDQLNGAGYVGKLPPFDPERH